MVKQLLVDNIDFDSVPAGTIKIDCLGAYIANDHLIRGQYGLTQSSLPLPLELSESESEEESGPLASTLAVRLAQQMVTCPSTDSVNAQNIALPQHNSDIIHMSVDIGGTLTKLVYFTSSSLDVDDPLNLGGKLHFQDFQTGNFEKEALSHMIQLIRKSIINKLNPPITYVMATGGGAHKFCKLMVLVFKTHRFPIQIVRKDEMECLIKGLDWLITKIPNEIFTYDLTANQIKFITSPYTTEDQIYPYLLVNIGSGVSMVKVTGPGPHGFERIGGSSLGGGTLWGLLSLLTDAKDYTEMLEMAQRGNNENIDLLVGDIYGTSYNKIGLKSTHIASSFAKVFKKLRFSKQGKPLTPSEKLAQFKQEDIARSLLYLISNNIGQIAYLQALRFDLKRIYFGGSYILGHMQTIHTLSYAVNFWSKGDMKSYFLRHEGYLGSVGAFMMGPNGDVHNGCSKH
uniref:Pantothenate kinase n=1 Tax=Candidozyma auris TaxID=498019 RepID=A0A0L0NSG7_CANAR